jgi:hypothetical protein
MANYSKIQAKAPDINQTYINNNKSFSSQNVIDANIQLLKDINGDLGDSILKWEQEFQIDKGIISCFIAIESTNRNLKPNKNHPAMGYMQIAPVTVYEIISKWNEQVEVPLSSSFVSYLKKQIPSVENFDRNSDPSSKVLNQISKALMIPDYNIALGTANIRWLLEAFAENGQSLLAKTIVAYNTGYYGAKNKLSGKLTTAQIFNAKSLSYESRIYLLKMFGVNGFLELYYKNLRPFYSF